MKIASQFSKSFKKGKKMAILHYEQTWVPYEITTNCSKGFCSIYCPQFCYFIFPPPPPFDADDSSPSSSAAVVSPLVVALVAILAAAFLLLGYYCLPFTSLLRLRCRRSAASGGADDEDTAAPAAAPETTWHASSSNGLDEAVIDRIAVYRYKPGEGVVDGSDCSVCLAEFREDDGLRLLPKCSHAFHLRCIDTWLKSHSNCPLCRANIVSPSGPPPPPRPPEPEEAAVALEEGTLSRTEDDPDDNATKESSGTGAEERNAIAIDIRDDIS